MVTTHVVVMEAMLYKILYNKYADNNHFLEFYLLRRDSRARIQLDARLCHFDHIK